jgi:hypothetical protein
LSEANWLSDFDVDGSLSLSVGWKSGTKIRLGQLTVGEDVADSLRDVVFAAVDAIHRREPEPWAPDADLSQETYLVIKQHDLGEAPALSGVQPGQGLASALMAAEDLGVLSPQELPKADLQFYVITIGSTPGARVSFLRRTNPRRGLRGGKLLTSYHDVLTRIEDPIFAFDDLIDLIFVDDVVLISSQSAFVALFRAQQTLMAQVPRWSAELASHIAITTDGQERLSARAIRDSRLRMRLEAIVKRGHLADVSPAVVRVKMTELGLDQDRLIADSGELMLEDSDIPLVLQFLNEDLFPGALTGTGFRADKKAAR